MNDAPAPASDLSAPTAQLGAAAARDDAVGTAAPSRAGYLWWAACAVLLMLTGAGVLLAWNAEQRVQRLEQELVRRQQDIAGQSTEARLMATQAQEGMRDAAAKVALLEARVAEVAIQRGQLEELIQSLSRSRDENLVVDIEAAIRVALQQNAITGSAEPLVATLKQSDERLARYSQPRLEGVRRAIARDLDRVRAVSVTDISALTIKLDEAARMIDELPLLALGEPRKNARKAGVAAAPPMTTPAASAPAATGTEWWSGLSRTWSALTERVWSEASSLVRVTRIDHPEAMLLVPEQAYFLRENLKLRLLNARLALLSRQFEIAQADLNIAHASLEKFFDRSARRTALFSELLKQVATQARQMGVPRPDDTLAALAAAAAGR